ncbi:hypothetical protein [Desulfurococcus mucosus]|uniref:Uncharacterized protein n=1 Tax=Desulfurococcus mucosus (strain ATCC 35584 / DSM 2162 / JCM 9187 / O7/1) TaxID=765177 RepID=E8R724_DESM0|nr:hypothetical protein [Desulfurococcus mucosus]ADV64457.1 hypothetical protein Desmu_0138 [Desulfurococcus mucosus DSM 2162]
MPKTVSVLLRRELLKRDLELLDIYRFSDREVVRIKDRVSGKVMVHVLKTRLPSILSQEDLARIASEIASTVRSR